MRKRTYTMSAHVAPDAKQPPSETISGGFAFGPFDAVKLYGEQNLPGFDAIPGGVRLSLTDWRFGFINHRTQMGADVYVKDMGTCA